MKLLTLFTRTGHDFGRKMSKEQKQERERILAVINSWCACEPRKMYACSCDVYVKVLLKDLGVKP